MRVFLIHGMARTPLSMAPLALRLRASGHRPSLFGYSVTFERLDRIAERFAEHVREVVGDEVLDNESDAEEREEGYAVVGHSLGNIITRLASPKLPPGFRRFVMLAPPNHPPATARALEDNFFFVLLTRDAGRKLCDDGFYDDLPAPDVPSLVIAGTRGPSGEWHPANDQAHDGLVTVDEAKLDGVPLVEIHGVHSFLPWRGDIARRVASFLEHGPSDDTLPENTAPNESLDEPTSAARC